MYLCVSSDMVDLSFTSSTLTMLMKSTKFIWHERNGKFICDWINYSSTSFSGIHKMLTKIESIVGTRIKRNKRGFTLVVQQYVSSYMILVTTQGKINAAGRPERRNVMITRAKTNLPEQFITLINSKFLQAKMNNLLKSIFR